jgi:phosphohistidine phosphatase SixA
MFFESFTATIIRHSITNKSANDLERSLTSDGAILATKLSERVRVDAYDRAFVSTAPRAQQTILYLTNGSYIDIRPMIELHLPPEEQNDNLDEMFEELGYSSFENYLAHKHGSILDSYGKKAINRVTAELKLENLLNPKILIVGHAICLNAVAIHLLNFFSIDTPEFMKILRTYLKECEGFHIEITFSNNGGANCTTLYLV